MAKLITETSYQFKIEEDKKGGNLYLMGVYSSANKKNRNGRVYPKEILNREVEKLREAIQTGTCVGQIGHPEQPETDLNKAAIKLESLEWKGDDVYGKSKVLNTPSGEVLKNLIGDEVTVGISSRGLGTLHEDGTVKEDFELLTYDVVASPSNHGSWLNGVYEGREFPTTRELEEKNQDGYSLTMEQAKKEYFKKVWQVIEHIEKSKDL